MEWKGNAWLGLGSASCYVRSEQVPLTWVAWGPHSFTVRVLISRPSLLSFHDVTHVTLSPRVDDWMDTTYNI